MIKNSPLFVCRIWQKNNYAFCVEWNDQHIQTFQLCDLQRVCPCANCRDEATGQRLIDPTLVTQTVRALSIQSVGRYGLKIHFTSGCSTGIYSFDQLRLME